MGQGCRKIDLLSEQKGNPSGFEHKKKSTNFKGLKIFLKMKSELNKRYLWDISLGKVLTSNN